MDKVLTHDAVINNLYSGMTIGIGGWGARRKPMSLIRAICQSDLKDLTLVSSVSYTHLTLPTNREV